MKKLLAYLPLVSALFPIAGFGISFYMDVQNLKHDNQILWKQLKAVQATSEKAAHQIGSEIVEPDWDTP